MPFFRSSKILGEAGKQEILQQILDLKSSSEEIFFRKLSLGAPVLKLSLKDLV